MAALTVTAKVPVMEALVAVEMVAQVAVVMVAQVAVVIALEAAKIINKVTMEAIMAEMASCPQITLMAKIRRNCRFNLEMVTKST